MTLEVMSLFSRAVFSPLTFVRARVMFAARVCYSWDVHSSHDSPMVGGGMSSIGWITANWWGHLPFGMHRCAAFILRIQTSGILRSISLTYRLRWSRGSVLAFGTQVRRFKPGRSRRIFKGEKILSTPSFGGEVKPSVPCRRFVAC